MAYRPKNIPPELYAQCPVHVTFNTIHPNLHNIELPISCCHPKVLFSAKLKPVTYLISYKPIQPDESNVDITHHAYYVDRQTWLDINAAVKKYGNNPKVD